jgi:hypothetical protein
VANLSLSTAGQAAVDAATTLSGKVAALNARLTGGTLRFKKGSTVQASVPVGTTPFVLVGGVPTMQLGSGGTVAVVDSVVAATHTAEIVGSGGALELSGLTVFGPGETAPDPSVTPFIKVGRHFQRVGQAVATSAKKITLVLTFSGLGSSVPSTAAAYAEVWDYTSGITPQKRCTLTADTYQETMVMQDSQMAAELGETIIRRCQQGGIWGEFQFFMTVWDCDGRINADSPGTPFCQTTIWKKPYGRWATYPWSDTFNRNTDVTYAPAHKVLVFNAAGTLLNIHQMHDNLPINDASLSENRDSDGKPVRPKWNCGQVLFWSQAKTRKSTLFDTFFPQFDSNALRQSVSRKHYSCNPPIPATWKVIAGVGGGYGGALQINGAGHFHEMPRWALGVNSTVADDPTNDGYGYSVDGVYVGAQSQVKSARITGFGDEPGSPGAHEMLYGNGGSRQWSRSSWPRVYAIKRTSPNWTRPKDNVHIDDLCDNWGKSYWQQPFHWFTDATMSPGGASDLTTLRDASMKNIYYGAPGQLYATAAKSIDMCGHSNLLLGSAPSGYTEMSWQLDKNGNLFWGGANWDFHHMYVEPGMHTLAYDSPAHVLSQRQAYRMSKLCRLGVKDVVAFGVAGVPEYAEGDVGVTMNSRVCAWRLDQALVTWKLGTTASVGIPQSQTLADMQADFEYIYNTIKPIYDANTTSPAIAAFKNLGCFAAPTSQYAINGDVTPSANKALVTASGPLLYYIGQVFIKAKRLGAWSAIRASSAAAGGLDYMISAMAKFSVDWVHHGNGRARWDPQQNNVFSGDFGVLANLQSAAFTTSDVPANWAAWATKFPASGQESWIRRADGSRKTEYGPEHMRAQWCFAMRDYFSEYNWPNVNSACSKLDAWYAEIAAEVAAASTPAEKRDKDWTYWEIQHSKVSA